MLFISDVLRAGLPALIVAGALLPAVPRAADSVLSLELAQRLAAERSLQLRAQDASSAAMREMAVAAGQLPDPVLKLGIDNLPSDGADRFSLSRDFMTQRRIGVSQEFTREAKRSLRSTRFAQEAERAAAERASMRAAIHRDAALAWLERYYAAGAMAIITDQIAAARLELEAAGSAYRGGRGSQADVLALQAALAMLEDRMSEVVRRERVAGAMLSRWVGEAAEWPLVGRPAFGVIPLVRADLESQLAKHPQLVTLAGQEILAETDARLAQANRTPDWSAELSYSQRGPAYSNMIAIAVSVPLQWDRGNRQDRELAARLAMVEQARAQRQDALRALAAEARALMAEWDTGRERKARYERDLIPLAAARSQALLAAYRGGRAALAEVLASRRAEIDLRLQALQIDADTAQIWARLGFFAPEADAINATNKPGVNPLREVK